MAEPDKNVHSDEVDDSCEQTRSAEISIHVQVEHWYRPSLRLISLYYIIVANDNVNIVVFWKGKDT